MAYTAKLTIAGLKDLPIYEFYIMLHQAMDSHGQPASGVFTGDIFFIVEGGMDTFYEWICDPTRTEKGAIKTYDNSGAIMVTYAFDNAFVTDVNESLIDHTVGTRNEFNLVTQEEDDNGNMGKMMANGVHLIAWENRPLIDAYDRARGFQRRTGNAFVTYFSLSCEKIRIRDVQHDNQWH